VPPGLAEQVRGTGAHFESRDIDPLAEVTAWVVRMTL